MESCWRRGELNRPPDSDSSTGKVLDSDGKSGTFSDFPEDDAGPKRHRLEKTQFVHRSTSMVLLGFAALFYRPASKNDYQLFG